MPDRPAFPPDFVWGVATSAYQIEGAAGVDGRGESIWDRFCATSGAVRGGASGAVACDHYHRYREDVALMRILGIGGYRFSIAWPRIVPNGTGGVNPRGLDFYDRLVDELLSAGIEPYPTLYHWDLPQALEDRGGWTNRATAGAFVDYADVVVRRLGDRIHHWMTHNEPWVVAWPGYGWGGNAPGRAEGARGALAASHHLLLSHGLATPVIRAGSPGAQVGIALNLIPIHPASDSEADCRATRWRDGELNRWYLDPLFRGAYPADLLERLESDLPDIQPGDLATIAAPLDFLGVNYYMRALVRADPSEERPGGIDVRPGSAQFTAVGWEVYPDGLTELLARLQRDYAPPRVYITENGAAFPDERTHDGRIRDPERQCYLQSHLWAAARAIAQGVPLSGYFLWSLLDNFEWAHAYSKRFGIVYVDYPTLERIPKASFEWYRAYIASQSGR